MSGLSLVPDVNVINYLCLSVFTVTVLIVLNSILKSEGHLRIK